MLASASACERWCIGLNSIAMISTEIYIILAMFVGFHVHYSYKYV